MTNEQLYILLESYWHELCGIHERLGAALEDIPGIERAAELWHGDKRGYHSMMDMLLSPQALTDKGYEKRPTGPPIALDELNEFIAALDSAIDKL